MTQIPKKNITLIGAGNLATHLGRVLQKSGFEIDCVYSRSEKSASLLAKELRTNFTTNIAKIPANSNFFIIVVKDDGIQEVAKKLKVPSNSIVMHTSGTIGIEHLKKFSKYGVFYPLQTFSKKKLEIEFNKIPLLIEASDEITFIEIQNIASKISERIIKSDSSERQKIHLAAVFASNFSNLMFSISDRILNGVNQDISLLLPLIEETVEKIKNNSPTDVQTGPAIRGDKKTIQQHLNLLQNDKHLKNIYEILTQQIILAHHQKKDI
jgi:predicted short-subunit dehydrogenase-like oxidoreductase (DUF2520 family)